MTVRTNVVSFLNFLRIWNIRSLTLPSDTFLVYFFLLSFLPNASAALKKESQFYDIAYRGILRRLIEKCRNTDVDSPSCRSYDLCSSNGNDGCCNFLCEGTRDMCYLIDVSGTRGRVPLIEKTRLSRREINNSVKIIIIRNDVVTLGMHRWPLGKTVRFLLQYV